jgi:hypothetical protein
MDTHALHHYPARAELPRWLIVGFISGAVAVLLFHQSAAALLHALQFTPRAPFSFTPTKPFGVPQLWSLAFWGALWGAVLAASLARLDGARLIGAATVFGAIAPTLVAWFIVAPLKAQPIAGGWAAKAMLVALIVNGAWGLGTGIGLYLFGRRNYPAPA